MVENAKVLPNCATKPMDLQDLLGCKVDVVTEKGLRERIHDRVLREAVPL